MNQFLSREDLEQNIWGTCELLKKKYLSYRYFFFSSVVSLTRKEGGRGNSSFPVGGRYWKPTVSKAQEIAALRRFPSSEIPALLKPFRTRIVQDLALFLILVLLTSILFLLYVYSFHKYYIKRSSKILKNAQSKSNFFSKIFP